MSLLFVHKLLIATAVVFCVGFCARGVVVAVRSGDPWAGVLAVISLALGVALAGYLRWLIRVKGQRLERRGRPERPG